MVTSRPRTSPDAAAPDRNLAPKSFTLFGQRLPADRLAPGLHVVATPIGNLRDISIRALAMLAGADAILAEDTRVSRTLTGHYGIASPLIAYHDHNAARLRPAILQRLRDGEALALISDAGTPLISDPGYKLVAEAIEAGVAVTCAPGASAALAALMIAGLPTDRFFFEGFLPARSAARRARLKELSAIPASLILYESPGRLADAIADASDMLGPRAAVIARELTKLHEEAIRGTLPELSARLTGSASLRGEIVVVIGPPAEDSVMDDAGGESMLDAQLRAALSATSLKQAVADVAAKTGHPRRIVYARALTLSGKQ